MDSILDRLDFYENPKCVIWHANVTQVVSFLHILARLPHKVKIASDASAVKLNLVRPYEVSYPGTAVYSLNPIHQIARSMFQGASARQMIHFWFS